MRLFLIRHGESEHGLAGRIAVDEACTGLTPCGVRQARALAERLREGGEAGEVEALLCSPALRARQTAEALSVVWPSLTPQLDPNLCEQNAGEAEGLTWDDYRTRFGAFDPVTEQDRPFAPGGESWRDFLARVRATLGRFAAEFPEGTVVAVTHAGFIVAALLVLCDIPRPGTGALFDPTHTALTEWEYSAGVWRLLRYNDAAHLQEIAG